MRPDLDLLDIENRKDPYATYGRLRRAAPVAEMRVDGATTLVVTRFDDVDAVIKSPLALVQPSAGEYPSHIGSGPAAMFYKLSLPHMDPPEHGKIRRVLLAAFNFATIARLQTVVSSVIDSALESIPARQPIDVAGALAARIPADIACAMLHVPVEQSGALFARVEALSGIISHTPLTEEALRRADEAAGYYFDFFDRLVQANRGLQDDDLLGALINAHAGRLISKEALATTLMGLFLASFHTTRTAIANLLHALATHPEQYQAVRSDRTQGAAAWEEMLRYDSPVHFIHRYASEPMTVGGRAVEPKTRFLLGLASANRDESHFTDPDRFDIRRPASRHLAFAFGTHFCAGAQLSRVEGKALLDALIRRFAGIHLGEAPVRRNYDLSFPFIEELHLRFEPVS